MDRISIFQPFAKFPTGFGKSSEQHDPEATSITRILSVFRLLKRVGFAVLVLWGVALVHAQPPDTLWTRHLGGAFNDFCGSLVVTGDNSIIVAGTSTASPGPNPVGTCFKVDGDGNTLWSHSFSSNGWGAFDDALAVHNNGILLAGSAPRYEGGDSDYWLLEVGYTGDSIWSRRYGSEATENCRALCRGSDGGFYLVGEREDSTRDLYNLLVVRVSVSGDSLWRYTESDSIEWYAADVVETADEGCLVFGTEYRLVVDVYAPFFSLIKLSSDGDIEWRRHYEIAHPNGGSPAASVAHEMAVTSDGNYVLAGQYLFFRHGELSYWDDSFVIKVDAGGDVIWYSFGGQSYDDWLNGVVLSTQHGIVAVGERELFHNARKDVYLVGLNPESGDTLWTSTIGGDSVERGYCIVETSNGSLVVGGLSRAFGQGDDDIWILMFDSTSEAHDRPILPIVRDLHLRAFPNPFNGSITIQWEQRGDVRLDITNIMGQRVYSIDVPRGTSLHRWEAADRAGQSLPSGRYYVTVQGSRFRGTQPIILMK